MATIKEKIERLKKELEEASNDEKFRNLAFVAGGNLTKSGHAYIRRQTEKICRLSHEYDLYIRIQRIIDGEVFALDDIDRCRLEIEKRYPQYEQPIDADYGILLAVEAIRKSFGNRFYPILYRHPIKIDFGTPNRRICIIHLSNFIEYGKRQEDRRPPVSCFFNADFSCSCVPALRISRTADKETFRRSSCRG